MKLVVATTNLGKINELRALLPGRLDLLTLTELGLPSPAETGTTFRENALIKARSALSAGLPVLAEDAGLEVDALQGQPGVLSARFAGPDATDAMNNALLLERLRSQTASDRRARFRSVVALALPDGREFCSSGAVEGTIVETPRGTGGFGYDPLFEIDDPKTPQFNGRTAAELTVSEKNAVSHRARALRALLEKLWRDAPGDPLLAPLLCSRDKERGNA